MGPRRSRRRHAVFVSGWLAATSPILSPVSGRAGQLPRFAGPINPFGLEDVGTRIRPAFTDIDGDGDLDVLIGSTSGSTYLFQNTGTAQSPQFTMPLVDAFGLTKLPDSWPAPAFGDIDGDGDVDAFIGELYGSTRFFRNSGSALNAAFATPSTNAFGLKDVGDDAAPTFADIDGDGDLDVFIGELYGSTLFFRNKGTAVSPSFASPSANPFGLVGFFRLASPTFVDIDGDGDLDAFVCARALTDGHDATYFFRNTRTAQSPGFAARQENPFGIGLFSPRGQLQSPAFVDIDGDGDLDAFFGEWFGSTYFLKNTGTAQTPAFFGILPAVAYNASPAVADIDGDGDVDALVGDAGNGTMSLFRNTGGPQSPAFAAPSVSPFGLADIGTWAMPAFADIDGDSDLDVLVGESKGSTHFFRNTGTAASPAFAAASVNPFGLADVGEQAAPAFADIDGDGDLDGFVGEYYGSISFFRNTGTAQSPAFATPAVGAFGLTDLGNHSAPSFADLDRDGDLDAFVGEREGATFWFENQGTAQSPAFAPAVVNSFGLTPVDRRAAPAFADLDGDGDLDAFVGAHYGATFLFMNTPLGDIFVDGFEPGGLIRWSSHVP